MRELEEMFPCLIADVASGRDVLVQGDLNHTPNDPEYSRWATTGLVDSYPQLANDASGGGTLLRPQPRVRLDYVFVSGALQIRLMEARPLNERKFRLYAERPDAVSLSDHLPQLARFRD